MKKEYLVNDNIALCLVDEKSKNDCVVPLSGKLNALTLMVNLKGEEQYNSLRSDYDLSLKENYSSFDLVNEEDGLIYKKKNTHLKSIELFIKKDFVQTLLPNTHILENVEEFFYGKENIKNLLYKRNNPKTQILAFEIFNNPYKNNLEKLHMESKILELLYLEFKELFNTKQKEKSGEIKFSKEDKEAIYCAREILLNNYSNPPSIKTLARMVAINDLKLKVGFNRFFNETPYSMSLENRLQKAKKLLLNSELNINEISSEVGYKYNSNFTKAFMKRFGVRPKDIMKTREYYY